MTSRRLVHKVTDALPPAAWDIIVSGFRHKKMYRQIAIELGRAGFHVSERTIARRAAEWRDMLAVIGTEAATTDLLQEVVHLVDVLDVGPDWALRARRRVQKAVAAFFDDPGSEQAHAIKLELARFRLEAFAANARAVDNAAPAAVRGEDASPIG